MNHKNIFYRAGYVAQVSREAMTTSTIRLEEDIIQPFYEIRKNGIIVAKVGYAYDFATWFPNLNSIKRPSLWHDIVCQAVKEGHLDKKWLHTANLKLAMDCITDGMPRWLAKKVLKYTDKYAGKVGKNKHAERSAPDTSAVNQDTSGGS